MVFIVCWLTDLQESGHVEDMWCGDTGVRIGQCKVTHDSTLSDSSLSAPGWAFYALL
jgi:hypothetical protein